MLDSRYLKAMDLARYKVDTMHAYKAYFDLVKAKIKEYSIRTEDTYNIDEKGFLIGFLTKSKRIFIKEAF